ncbi:MAG: hypothetical protein IPP74_09035 [Alphaproteobacteria bacterium]|nr:hypothetical protein [Alphaproteobacteria bacterium]
MADKKTATTLSKRTNDKFGLLAITTLTTVGLSLIAVSSYGFLFMLLALMPGIVAYSVDKTFNKYASKCICTMNFTGFMPSIFEIFNSHDPSAYGKIVLLDPLNWLISYTAASCGWLLVWSIPQITMLIYISRSDSRGKRLHNSQERLIEEWGQEVTEKQPTA